LGSFSAEKAYEASSRDKDVPSAVFRSKTFRSSVVGFDPLDDKDNLLKDVTGTPRAATRISTLPSNTDKKNSSVFANTGRVDRFGHSTKTLVRKIERQIPTPGPGAYLKLNGNSKQLISSSFFMSSSDRFITNLSEEEDIGPGRYNADKMIKNRSFHSNTGHKWV
jgi:hypothetical protein